MYSPNDWLNPMNRIVFHNAVKNRTKRVRLGDGRVFLLDYKLKPGHVRIQVDGHFAPMGWFELSKVEQPEWIENLAT